MDIAVHFFLYNVIINLCKMQTLSLRIPQSFETKLAHVSEKLGRM